MKNNHKCDAYVRDNAFILSLDMVQYDTGNTIEIKVKDMDIPAGTTGKAFFLKPSGKFVYEETGVVVSPVNNTATVSVHNQSIAEAGLTKFQVKLYDGTDVISTFYGKIHVSPSLEDASAERSRTVMTAFDIAVHAAIEEIGQVIDKTVSVPDRAADAGAVGDIFDFIRSKYGQWFGTIPIFKPTENLFAPDFAEKMAGYWQRDGFHASSNYVSYKVFVKPETQYTLTAYYHVLVFFGADGRAISDIGQAGALSPSPVTITTPKGTAYIRITLRADYDITNYMVLEGTSLPSEYVSGAPVIRKEVLSARQIGMVYFLGSDRIVYDVEAGKITFPAAGNIQTGSEVIQFNMGAPLTIDAATAWLAFEKKTGRFWTGDIHTWKEDNIFLGLIGNKTNAETNTCILGADVKFIRKKVVAFLGDSITAGVATSKAFHMYLSDWCGIKALNYGDGGTGFYKEYVGSGGLAADGTEGLGTAYNRNGNNNFLQRVSHVPANSAAVVVFGGTNDFGNSTPMERFDENVRGVIEYLLVNRASADVIFATPLHRTTGGNANSLGYKLADYVQTMLEICHEYGVMCINLYDDASLCAENAAVRSALMPDGLHPNAAGHERIARRFYSLISAIVK